MDVFTWKAGFVGVRTSGRLDTPCRRWAPCCRTGIGSLSCNAGDRGGGEETTLVEMVPRVLYLSRLSLGGVDRTGGAATDSVSDDAS